MKSLGTRDPLAFIDSLVNFFLKLEIKLRKKRKFGYLNRVETNTYAENEGISLLYVWGER